MEGASTDTLITFMNDQENQLETFLVPFQPVSVEFDPQAKILSTAVLGIEEQSSPPAGGVSTMYLGPNPAVGASSINWSGTGEMELVYSVYDLSGRVVLEGVLEPSERSLDLAGIPSGTYIVDVTAAGGIRQAARLVILGE